MSMTPNSVRKRSLFSCATTSSSPSASKKCSRSIDLVTSRTWLAMPAMASASPAVVMVCMSADERERLLRDRDRTPALLADGQRRVVALRRGPDLAALDRLKAAGVPHGRANAIEPRPLVRGLRGSERRTAQLLGVKAIVHLLRRIAADRQSAGQSLGLEAVAKAGHVARVHGWQFSFICTNVK